MNKPNARTGTLCVFLAALLYSIGGLCIKVIPWNGMAINGGRTAIALVVIGGYLAVIRHPPRFNRWILLGSLCIFGTNALYSVANKLTTAANTIVLQFTAPIFVIVFSALFWHKKPQKLDLAACAVVFGGVLFFFVDSLEAGGALGNLLAILSGAAYGGVFLLNDFPDADAISAVFWGDVLSAVTGLPFLLQETQFTQTALVSLVVLGVFRRQSGASAFGRRLPEVVIRNACALFVLYLTLFLTGGLLLCCVEGIPLMSALFEAASAIGTVGLTLGVTTELSSFGQLILIFLMYFGRVGGLTMIYAMTARPGGPASQYPQEQVTVG